MNILYATYLFLSAAILLVLAVIGWRRRSVPAGREFALFSASIALLVAFYALELTQSRLEVLKSIVGLEWLFCPYIATFWLLFGLVWCGHGHLANRTLRAGLLTFSTLTVLLALSNDYHGLIYTKVWLDTTGPFPLLRVQNGLWYNVYWTYTNICILIASILFVQKFRNAMPLHRRQALIIMLASFIPWITDIGFELGIGNGIYLTAFGLSISALLFAWGVLRQQLLDLTPVARYGLVEMMRDPVLVFDGAGRVVDHNRAAGRLLHDLENHGSETTRADICRQMQGLAKALERAESGLSDTFNYQDQVFSLSLTTLHPTTKSTLTLCLFHDITEQSRAEDELRLLNATLEERVEHEVALNRAKDQALARQARIAAMGEMVAAIAHQWRQPLAILSMIVQDFHAAARQEGTPSPAEWDEFKADAMAQIRHMSQTIEEFRNFQRPDQKRERFPVVRCMEESLRLCSAQFREHNIRQELHVNAGDSLCCFGTPSQLTQVVLNLLVNARDAIEDSRMRFNGHPDQGTVSLALNSREQWLQISVTDNGCGVAEELSDRLFEPYITSKEAQGGTGLGLYLSKMLVEKGFGGKLSHAPLPEGACFIIELPVAAEGQS